MVDLGLSYVEAEAKARIQYALDNFPPTMLIELGDKAQRMRNVYEELFQLIRHEYNNDRENK